MGSQHWEVEIYPAYETSTSAWSARPHLPIKLSLMNMALVTFNLMHCDVHRDQQRK